MAKRRRRKNYAPLYAAAAVVIVIALAVAIVAIIAGGGSINGGDDKSTSSGSQQAQAPTTSQEAPTSSQPESSEPSSSAPTVSYPTNGSHRLDNGDYIEYTKSGVEELDEWYLKLTNKWKPAGEDFVPENLVRINNDGYMFDSRAYGAYKDMVSAAWEDGVNIYAISAYRSYSRQQTLYKQRIQRFINQGYSEEEATEKAGTIVAVPGTSEHQIGLAIDFNSVEQEFEDTKQGKWLAENCTDYGFILRYPTDKTEITGIIYEPWHFRFVGVKHAKQMEALDMCLEEYVEYLKAQ